MFKHNFIAANVKANKFIVNWLMIDTDNYFVAIILFDICPDFNSHFRFLA